MKKKGRRKTKKRERQKDRKVLSPTLESPAWKVRRFLRWSGVITGASLFAAANGSHNWQGAGRHVVAGEWTHVTIVALLSWPLLLQ